MARLSLGTLAAGVFVVGTVSCTDRDLPVEPETPGPSAALTSERAQTGPPSGDVPTLKRFDVDVEASGTFRPGAPVTLRVRVTGLTDVTNAELRVALPEVSGAVASDWGDGFRYPPTGVRVGAVLTHIFDVARGASSEFTVPVEVPVEGYYHVVTTLRAPEGAPIVEGGRVALNTAVDESWLLITEAGGELTSTFEPERIPTGYLEKGGPFRSSRAAVSRRNPAEADAEPVPAGPSVDGGAAIGPTSEAGVHHEITYQIKYFDVDADSYLPLPHAYVVVSLCTYPFLFSHECEDFEPADYTFTDSNGYFSFLCDEDEYRVAVHTFRPTSFYVHYGDAYAEGDVDSDCGGSFEDIMVSTKAKIFRNLYATVDGTIDLFGDDRSFVDVYEDAENEPTNSYYDPDNDDIHILTDLVWDSPGAFITAHEYGHAFHEDALLGDTGWGNCPVPHYIDTESGLLCAFSEGFADYFGSATRPDLSGYAAYFSSNNAFPGCVSRNTSGQCTGGTSYEGSVIEGAFAAFLYDLTDASVEPHDSIVAPGSYVADLIRTCKIDYGGLYRANGPDDIAYCAENAVNPGSCFTVRGWVTYGYQEAAQEPTGWTSGRVNEMWRWNMYEKPDSTVSC